MQRELIAIGAASMMFQDIVHKLKKRGITACRERGEIQMPQPKPERMSFDDILRLVDQLSPEEQDKLAEEMKLQWLRREVKKGIDAADRGELIDGEEVFKQLLERNAPFRQNGRQKGNP